jgi:hypothetical protein
MTPGRRGKIARVRQRQYLIEKVVTDARADGHTLVQMVCMDDDAPGRPLEVLWERELGAEVIDPEIKGLGEVASLDEARVFAAYLHSMKWRSVTATDGKLFQSRRGDLGEAKFCANQGIGWDRLWAFQKASTSISSWSWFTR